MARKKQEIEDMVELEDSQETDVIVVDDEPSSDLEIKKRTSTKADPEWTQYVLSHLTSDELCYGNPRMFGLRRLIYLLEGDIIDQDEDRQTTINSDVIMSSNTYSIRILGKDGVERTSVGSADAYVILKKLPGFEEVQYNIQDPRFGKFVTAMAETRAKSRCFINALAIQCNASEEMVNGVASDDITSEVINEIQLSILEKIALETNINIGKFINKVKKEYKMKFDRISNILEREAKVILNEIQKYCNDKEVTEDIKGYDSNWRNK